MAAKHMLYTAASTIYGKAVIDSTPWADDAVALTEDGTYPGVYAGDTDNDFLYLQAGGSPDPSDTYLGKLSEFYYGSVPLGDLFFQQRLHAWDWENGTLEDKVKGLYNAKMIIERFRYIGDKVSTDQGLKFPRQRTLEDGTVCQIGGTSGVPGNIENACYLIADALLAGRVPAEDFEALKVKVETFGPVRTEFATNVGPEDHIANLVPSPEAWAMIRPFFRISSSFSVKKA